jgi:hypothetical protein
MLMMRRKRTIIMMVREENGISFALIVNQRCSRGRREQRCLVVEHGHTWSIRGGGVFLDKTTLLPAHTPRNDDEGTDNLADVGVEFWRSKNQKAQRISKKFFLSMTRDGLIAQVGRRRKVDEGSPKSELTHCNGQCHHHLETRPTFSVASVNPRKFENRMFRFRIFLLLSSFFDGIGDPGCAVAGGGGEVVFEAHTSTSKYHPLLFVILYRLTVPDPEVSSAYPPELGFVVATIRSFLRFAIAAPRDRPCS